MVTPNGSPDCLLTTSARDISSWRMCTGPREELKASSPLPRLNRTAVPSLHLCRDDEETPLNATHPIPFVKLLRDDPVIHDALSKYMRDTHECALCHQRVSTSASAETEWDRVEMFIRFLGWRTSMDWVGPPVTPSTRRPPTAKRTRGRPRRTQQQPVPGPTVVRSYETEVRMCRCCTFCGPHVNQVWALKEQLDAVMGEMKEKLGPYLRRPSEESTKPIEKTKPTQPIKEEIVDAVQWITDELENDIPNFDDDDTSGNNDDCWDNGGGGDDDDDTLISFAHVNSINHPAGKEKSALTLGLNVSDGNENTNGPGIGKNILSQTEGPETIKMVLSEEDKERLCKTSKAFSNVLKGKLGGKSIFLLRPTSSQKIGSGTVGPQRIVKLKSTAPIAIDNELKGPHSSRRVVLGKTKRAPKTRKSSNDSGTCSGFKPEKSKRKRKVETDENNGTINDAPETSNVDIDKVVSILNLKKRKRKWKPKSKCDGKPKIQPPPKVLTTELKEELKETSSLFNTSVGRNHPFKCYIDGCMRSYKNYQMLTYHQRNFHFKQKPFECTECQRRYPTFADLRKHKILRHLKDKLSFLCPVEGCGAVFGRQWVLQQHSSRVHKHKLPPTPCPVCGFISIKREHILHHIQKTHPFHELVHCNKCNKRLFSNEEFETHECVVEKKLPKSRDFADVFKEERRTITRVDCPDCKFSFVSQEDLTTSHLTSERRCPDPSAVCDICAEVCPKGLFSLHMSRHYCLEGCDTVFNTRRERNAHMAEIHLEWTANNKRRQVRKTNPQPKQSLPPRERRRQMLPNWGKAYPFKCDYEQDCLCAYKNEWEMKQHKRRYHLKERPYPCDKCDNVFFLPHMLKKHKRRVHPEKDDEVYHCDWPDCQESFAWRYVLNRHKSKVHLNIRKTKYKCRVCETTFHSEYTLRKHYDSIHTGGGWDYQCSVCGKLFYLLADSYPEKHGCSTVSAPIGNTTPTSCATTPPSTANTFLN